MAIKTLHITNSYHPASGGIRTFYHALLDAANRQRRFVRLVVPAGETSTEEIGDFGRIYRVASPPVPVLDSRYRWMLPHTYAWRHDTPLRRILATERPDLVEVCDKFWLIYLSGVLRRGWIAGVPVPVIVGLTCERVDDNVRTYVSSGRIAQTISQYYMRLCYVPRFDFHIAASDYIAAEIRGLFPSRLRGRLHVCPMGVDYDAFAAAAGSGVLRQVLLRRIGAGENAVLLLYAGRLSKEKNLPLLSSSLARLSRHPQRDYRLLIAGDGPDVETLRAQLEALAPGQSHFLGHCEPSDLPGLYHAADIFVHPNPREPFGIAPLQAMAAGLPLVAPSSGGLITYANPENSWLSDDTPAAFAQAIRDVHADDATRLRKTDNARLTAAQFNWPRVTENYFRLYDHFHDRLVREGLSSTSGSRLPQEGSSEACSVVRL